MQDPRLIVWIENDLYDWKTGLIKLISLLVFKQPVEEMKDVEENKEGEEDLVLEGLDD